MTVNLLTAVPSGMVLLADSMLMLGGRASAVVTTFENAEKLIPLGRKPMPAAAMISGAGDINGKLVSALLRKAGALVDTAKAAGAVDHAAVFAAVRAAIDPEWRAGVLALRAEVAANHSKLDELMKINTERAAQTPPQPPLASVEPKHVAVEGEADNDPEAFISIRPSILTVVVATYFDESPRATEMWWPGVATDIVAPTLKWWGTGSTAVSRLILGFDFGRLEARAAAEAAQATPRPAGTGVPPGALVDDAQRALAYAVSVKSDFQMGIPLAAIPLQDAIEFTEYLGKVACGFDKFSLGPAGVGGPLDVLVLLPNRRKWVRRKEIHTTLE
jgi:hypothetical protein